MLRREREHPTPPFFVYLFPVLIPKGSVTMALRLHSNRQCISHKREGNVHFSALTVFSNHTNSMRHCCSAGSCRTSEDQLSSSSSGHGSSDSSNSKKVEVIDLTLDSSSDDEGQDSPPPPPQPLPPPPKRACPSLSPTSPPVINKGSDTHLVL